MSISPPISPVSPTSPTASTSTSQPILAPEIEQTLARLSAYRNVRGVMILSRRSRHAPPLAHEGSAPGHGPSQGAAAQEGVGTGQGVAGILSSTGSVFEGESGKRYAQAVEGIVSAAAIGLDDCDPGVSLLCHRGTGSSEVGCWQSRDADSSSTGRAQIDAHTDETARTDHYAR
jgi:dynein light chain roadblock-type